MRNRRDFLYTKRLNSQNSSVDNAEYLKKTADEFYKNVEEKLEGYRRVYAFIFSNKIRHMLQVPLTAEERKTVGHTILDKKHPQQTDGYFKFGNLNTIHENKGLLFKYIVNKLYFTYGNAGQLWVLNKNLHELIQFRKNAFVQPKNYNLAKKITLACKPVSKEIEHLLKKAYWLMIDLGNATTERQTHQILNNMKPLFIRAIELTDVNLHRTRDLVGRLNIDQTLVGANREINHLLIKNSDLQTGDILMSFKSKDYLKKVLLSKTISYFTGSQVTHAMICFKRPNGQLKVIDSHGETHGVHIRNFEIEAGEVFIVLRPKINYEQRFNLLKHIIAYHKMGIGYSKKKLLGVLPTGIKQKAKGLFSRKYQYVTNVSKPRNMEFFCSEYVNQVFKDAGVYLTHKSADSSVVYPSDIVRSSMVLIKGLIFSQSERSREIIFRHLAGISFFFNFVKNGV